MMRLILSMLNVWSSSKEKSIVPSNAGSSSGSCIDSMYGCFKASSMVILVAGFRSNILSKRSRASGGAVGKSSDKGTFSLTGRELMYLRAYSLEI